MYFVWRKPSVEKFGIFNTEPPVAQSDSPCPSSLGSTPNSAVHMYAEMLIFS